MKNRPSIMLVNRVYPPASGASGRLMHDLARHFVRSGHRVTILSTDPKGATHKSRGPITITRIKGVARPNIWGYAGILFSLWRAMQKAPAHDVLITLSDPPLLHVAGALVSRKKNMAHVHWSHDVYPDLFPLLGVNVPAIIYNRLKSVSDKALKGSSQVVAISNCMKHHLVAAGHNTKRVTIIENWPDLELTGEAPAKEDETRNPALPHSKKLRERRLYSSPTGEKFRILYAGNIGRAHPMDTVVEAAKILQKTNPDIEFVFVGKGEGFERLGQKRALYNLDNIRLIPPQPRHRLRELMESGDVHLVTMKDSVAGLLLPCKFYSALAVQRPVLFIGSAKSDIARIISQTGCGRTIKEGQPKVLASEIARLRERPEAWFTAHEGCKQAMTGRTGKDAFAKWDELITKVAP